MAYDVAREVENVRMHSETTLTVARELDVEAVTVEAAERLHETAVSAYRAAVRVLASARGAAREGADR